MDVDEKLKSLKNKEKNQKFMLLSFIILGIWLLIFPLIIGNLLILYFMIPISSIAILNVFLNYRFQMKYIDKIEFLITSGSYSVEEENSLRKTLLLKEILPTSMGLMTVTFVIIIILFFILLL